MNPFALFSYFNVLLSPFSKLVEEPEACLLLAYSVFVSYIVFHNCMYVCVSANHPYSQPEG